MTSSLTYHGFNHNAEFSEKDFNFLSLPVSIEGPPNWDFAETEENKTVSIYGTIPSSSSSEPSKRVLVSRVKERIQTALGTRTPWNEMFQLDHFSFPSLFKSFQRINTNTYLFPANYVIIILIILFLSLLWPPNSLIILILMMAAWLFLYFLRDDTLILFGYEIDERFVASLLLLVTTGMLFLTNVTNNVTVGISMWLGVALVHAVMRDTLELGFSGNGEEDKEEAHLVSADPRETLSFLLHLLLFRCLD